MEMRTIIIGFFSVVLATTNAKAAVGENMAELIARYGEPENGSAPDLAVWKTKQGEVFAILENGKAVIMIYNGVDETTKSALLEQNIPKGQKWVDGKAFKDWRQLSDNPGPKEIDKAQSWQTTDGTLWAVYGPEEKTFEVGNAEAWKGLVKGAESLFEGFVFEPFKGKVPAQYADDPQSDLSGADQDFIADVAQEDAMNELEQNPNAYKGKEAPEIEKIGQARALGHNLRASDAIRYQGAFRQVIEDRESQHH